MLAPRQLRRKNAPRKTACRVRHAPRHQRTLGRRAAVDGQARSDCSTGAHTMARVLNRVFTGGIRIESSLEQQPLSKRGLHLARPVTSCRLGDVSLLTDRLGLTARAVHTRSDRSTGTHGGTDNSSGGGCGEPHGGCGLGRNLGSVDSHARVVNLLGAQEQPDALARLIPALVTACSPRTWWTSHPLSRAQPTRVTEQYT